MQCEEAQKLNLDFIKGKLEVKTLGEYIKHIESCKDCYEELDIYYIVTKGLEGMDIDSDESYNFPKLLSRKIQETKLYLKLRSNRRRMTGILSVMSYSLLLFVIIQYFAM